ncbi:MAG: hypothetical protein HeimC3_22530 [Candidatus Heimdallarchaeota archaeon LC_3]|nr:MAG: hypothetical protein HeimC3_22530 [Candidatus Heimdallarchaeota archaeon LC_3]
MNTGEDERMGMDEEIFVVRDGWPIGYIEYSGTTITERVDEKDGKEIDSRKIHKEWGTKIAGRKFLEILEKLPDEEKGSIEQYIKEYFQKVGIKATDEVFISVG